MPNPPTPDGFARIDDLQALAAMQDEAEAEGDDALLIAGRYQVLATLGQGGMGLVYRARDTRLGRIVAVKTILARYMTHPQASRRFFREAEALARLNHPHILTLFDSGQDGDLHFLVMELGGRDLTRLLEQHGGRLPLTAALYVGLAVARALTYAHRHGIIHRDLKPANILVGAAETPIPQPLSPAAAGERGDMVVRGDTVVKVMDFGLAKVQGASAITAPQAQIGTPHYMSPEQVLGQEADARADLYALGVLLYELTAGVRPFDGDDTQSILSQHLNLEPVPPSVFNDEVPGSLETLILRLLEKDPARRPATADEVVAVLEGIDPHPQTPSAGPSPLAGGRGASESAPPARGGQPEGRGGQGLYRRTFAGRDAELRQLRAAFDAAVAGQGALVMVVGEPGIGKTALCEQLATYVTQRGGLALWGHSYEEGSLSLPYLPFVAALRSYVQARPIEALQEELGTDTDAAEVARIVPALQERLGVELRSSGDPEEARWRLLEAVSGFIRTAAQKQPLVIFVEDLHWADRGTLDLLVHLARNLAGARLLVVGTYRNVEVDRAHPLSKTLAELRRTGSFARLLLTGLAAEEVQRMLEAIAGHDVTPAFVAAVQHQTEGNPLFVQEVVRYLAESGRIEQHYGRAQRVGDTPLIEEIPEGLRDVIGKRLSGLSAECNRVLQTAAVIGRDFGMDTLLTVAGLTENVIESALEEAVRMAVLEDRSSGGAVRFRFSHAFIRQTLYEEIFTPRRIRLHQQVARALEGQYAARLEEHAAELAEHFAQSASPEDLEKAVRYSGLAAQRAMAVYAYSEAVRHLEQALEVHEVLDPEDKVRRCDLLLALGEALILAGVALRAAEAVAPEALALAEALRDGSRASRVSLMALEALRLFGAATIAVTPAWRQWSEIADRYAPAGTVDRVRADRFVSLRHLATGEFRERRARNVRALELARQLDDPDVLFAAAFEFLNGPPAPQHWNEYLRLADEFTQRPRQGVSPVTLALVLYCGSVAFLIIGDRGRAEELWQQLAELGEHTRTTRAILESIQIQVLVATLGGDLEGALAFVEHLTARAEELGSPVYGRQFAAGLARQPLFYLGRGEELMARQDQFRESTRGQETFMARNIRALLLARIGRTGEAQMTLHQQMAVVRQDNEAPTSALVTLLQSAVLVGDRSAAEVLLSRLAAVGPVLANAGMGGVELVGGHLGAAAVFLGRLDEARRFYGQALEISTKVRHCPEITLTRLALAELDAEEGHVEAAREHLAFCIPELEQMKMRPALEKALALRESLASA